MVVLVLLAVVAFAVYAQASSEFAGRLFPFVRPRPYFEMISAAVVGALAASLVVSYPLARLFPRRYWLAGLIVALPYMELRVSWLIMYFGKDEPRIMTMSGLELLIYPAAIVFCTWGFTRFGIVGSKSEGRASKEQA
ncbi:MAG: hypothetical protein WBM34_00405 [Woeseiaceae bacterium]